MVSTRLWWRQCTHHVRRAIRLERPRMVTHLFAVTVILKERLEILAEEASMLRGEFACAG